MSKFRGFALLTALALFAASVGTSRPSAFAGGGGGGDVAAVPDVVGRTRADAAAALTAEGFLVGIYEIAGDPPDTVALQTPAANSALPRGGIVCLDVRRKEADPTPAPRAIGLSASAAVAAFGRLYDLRFESVAGPASERGKILTQAPAEGQPLALRGPWTLRYVADPSLPPVVAVPDTTGLTAAQALDALAVAGLNGQIVETSIPGAPVDLVIGQLPLPGSEVSRENAVRVVVTVAAEGGAGAVGTPPVPNVVGLSESAAKAALDEAGFDATVEYVQGDASQAFLVVDQNPKADVEAPEGTPVALRVVKFLAPPPGPSGVAMPDLIGLTAWQAEDLLVSIGLRANPILMDNPSVPELRVFAQQLTTGSLLPAGSSVSYRVSRPKPQPVPVVVPNLYGRSAGAAVALAAQAGVTLTLVEIQTNSYPAWRVFSQSVAAYVQVPSGTVVIARVARPTQTGTTVIVPDLSDKTSAQAMSMLATAGLSANLIEVVAPGHPPLKVFTQQPAAGAQVPAGSLVQAKVAKLSFGWKVVPELFGMTKPQAVAAVLAAGLQPDPDDVVAFGKPAGKVFAQTPPHGVLKPAGSTVAFKVAKPALIVVPYVFGMTQAQADATLAGVGLTGNATYQLAPAKPFGKVFDQSPNAGAMVGNGTQVQYFIAGAPLPPAVAMVPGLFGLTKAQAIVKLQAFGFVADPSDVFAPGKPVGLVYTQAPAANTGAAVGTVVHFQIAKGGIPMVLVPNLIGLTPAQANAALAFKGLSSSGTVVFKFGKPLNAVYSQSVSPNVAVPKGTVISWKANP